MSKFEKTHGDAGRGKRSPEYTCWMLMKQRCFNPKSAGFKRYGGRGIRVCDRWSGEGGYENFLLDVGKKPTPTHSLDRFPNNDGNYEPGNVRWATPVEQSNNTRRSRWLVAFGERLTVAQWSKRTGIARQAIEKRCDRGWVPERALSAPLRVTKRVA
jgi:hypothetical protein